MDHFIRSVRTIVFAVLPGILLRRMFLFAARMAYLESSQTQTFFKSQKFAAWSQSLPISHLILAFPQTGKKKKIQNDIFKAEPFENV